MKHWLVMRNLLGIVLLTAVALGIIWGLLAVGAEQYLVPNPDVTAEELVAALAAHRYAPVPGMMLRSARESAGEDALARLVERIEAAHGWIDSVTATGSQRSGDRASVTLEVQFGDGTTQNITLPLAKEDYLWRVASLEPVEALARPAG